MAEGEFSKDTLFKSALETLGHALIVTLDEEPGVEDQLQVQMTVQAGGQGWRLTLKIEELAVSG